MKENIKLLREVAKWLETPEIRLLVGHWRWNLKLKDIAREMEITEKLLDIPENLKRRNP